MTDEKLLKYYYEDISHEYPDENGNIVSVVYANDLFNNEVANEMYEALLFRLKRLLEIDPNLERINFGNKDAEEKTALIISAKISAANDEVLNFLLQDVLSACPKKIEEFDVNAQDIFGRTALHYLFAYAKTEQIEQLINLGAKTDIRDEFGLTPLEYSLLTEEQLLIILRSISVNGHRPSNYRSDSSLAYHSCDWDISLRSNGVIKGIELKKEYDTLEHSLEQCNKAFGIKFNDIDELYAELTYGSIKTNPYVYFELTRALINLEKYRESAEHKFLVENTIKLLKEYLSKITKETVIEKCVARKSSQEFQELLQNYADNLTRSSSINKINKESIVAKFDCGMSEKYFFGLLENAEKAKIFKNKYDNAAATIINAFKNYHKKQQQLKQQHSGDIINKSKSTLCGRKRKAPPLHE